MKRFGKFLALSALVLAVVLPGQVSKVFADVNPQNAGSRVNVGTMDTLQISGNKLIIRGWHALDSSNSISRGYHFLFIMDATTDREISRGIVNNESYANPVWSVNRPDVVTHIQKNYGVTPPLQCGFAADLQITAAMRGKKIYIMSRYSTDSRGNSTGRYADLFFNSTRIYIP